MKIGIQTWGSHGDIRPLMALAEGLQLAGHEVTLVITSVHGEGYDSSVLKSGVNVQNVASPVIRDKDEYAKIEQVIFSETDPVKQVQIILDKLFVPAEDEMFLAAETLCAENDLVIGHFFHYPLHVAAEKSACPYANVMLVHSAIPSRFSPPTGFPALGKLANRLAWWLVKTALNKALKIYPDKLRVVHGLEPASDLLTQVWASKQLTLIAVSSTLCQPQDDWPAQYKVTGFFDLANASTEARRQDGLDEFLAHGEAPVYITFGSAMSVDLQAQKEVIKQLSEAAEQAGVRAIIQAPLWKECGFVSTPEIYYVCKAPHKVVFPRCKVIIHHGGAGTTQAALLAGRPCIIIAHTAEQAFWGLELMKKGVAPEFLWRKNLTPENLSKRITEVLHSEKITQKASTVASLMEKENGVDLAVKLIDENFKV